jgi:hypothetical protein
MLPAEFASQLTSDSIACSPGNTRVVIPSASCRGIPCEGSSILKKFSIAKIVSPLRWRR